SPWCAGPRWPSTWTRRPTSCSSAAPGHTARRPPVDDGVGVLPLLGLPEVQAGDDLAALLLAAASRAPVSGLRDGDVLVVTHKVVAKAEGCAIDLRTVEPSAFARAIAARWDKDARQVEVVLRESARIVRMDRGVLICETRHGYVCANAGVDRSNAGAPETVLTLPRDPDASARAARARSCAHPRRTCFGDSPFPRCLTLSRTLPMLVGRDPEIRREMTEIHRPTLGETLRAARESKRRKLPEVAQKTRIPLERL